MAVFRGLQGKIYPGFNTLGLGCFLGAVKFTSKLAKKIDWVIDSGLSRGQIYASIIIGAAHALYFCSIVWRKRFPVGY